MSYKVGVIGTGDIAYYHAQAMRSISEVELVAACDISEKALEAYNNEFKVPNGYLSIEKMLEKESLDVVIICTWGNLHMEQSNLVARSGKVKGILCEKPIATTAKQCQDMIQVAKENNVFLIEAFKFRHHPQHLKMKEIVDSGKIGGLRALHASFTCPLFELIDADNWRMDLKRGAGSVFDSASYCINFSRFIVGRAPKTVSVIGQFGEKSGADHSTAIQLEYPGGITAQISSSYCYCYSQEVTVYGSKSMLRGEMAFNMRQPMAWNNPSLPVSINIVDDELNVEKFDFPGTDQFIEQIKHVIDCLEGKVKQRIELQESLDNMATIDAIYESMKKGTGVEVKKYEA